MPNATKHPDPYRFHRAALAPLLPHATGADLEQAVLRAVALGESAFTEFLCEQGLASMWDKLLTHNENPDQLSQASRDSLHQARMHATGAYLIQQNSLKLIKRVLDEAGIDHVVYKGADIRERYYDEPALRPATDIDLLVSGRSRLATIMALKRRGFEFHAAQDNISHEANLNKGNTSIDIHWDIMRPGRTRVSMVEELLGSRQDCGSHWGMSDEANLFVMLVHPVFTKYSTAPQAALMRMVDLVKVLARGNINWQELVALLDKAGLKTAAWITLRWLQLLTNTLFADNAMEMLQPGRLRRKYLDYWIRENLASQLLNKPAYVQLGLTLPAHDRLGDAVRAVRRARELQRSQQKDLQNILGEVAAE